MGSVCMQSIYISSPGSLLCTCNYCEGQGYPATATAAMCTCTGLEHYNIAIPVRVGNHSLQECIHIDQKCDTSVQYKNLLRSLYDTNLQGEKTDRKHANQRRDKNKNLFTLFATSSAS